MHFIEMEDSKRRYLERACYDYLPFHILLKPAEIEATYGLKKETVRKWFYRGHLKGVRMKGGLRYRRVDVERIIRERMPHLLERFKNDSNPVEFVS
jgi:hypothetical protein